MATQAEDPASVLEQFMHEAANLPAEINYMMEEIQAKDKEMQKFLAAINSKDSTLQKHVKANTSMQPHPKESDFSDTVKKHYESCTELQSQKIVLSEKACAMLERQIKKLDMKIRELQSDGQLLDGPPLPSVFNRKPDVQKPFADMPAATMPLQAASINQLNTNAHRVNQQVITAMRQAQSRQLSQLNTATTPAQRSSAPATPAAVIQQQQRQPDRELSAGPDNKRRKLTAALGTLNIPAQPSSLRQSSLGPGTPKAGTPGSSRAGSIPRTLGQQAATTKKSALTKRGPAHAALNKLKGKHNKHARLSAARKKTQSPSVRGGRGATAVSEEDSVLSSGDPSDTDASQSRSRRANKKAPAEDVEMAEEEDIEDEGDEDDRRYCTCNQRSYGEMVACENDDCPYQWFHTGCLNMKKVPDEDEDWYCPTCRQKPEIIEKMKAKLKKQKK